MQEGGNPVTDNGSTLPSSPLRASSDLFVLSGVRGGSSVTEEGGDSPSSYLAEGRATREADG